MFPNGKLPSIATFATFVLFGQASLSFGQQLRLDTQIETPAQNNNALELPEKHAGETIQFQLFAPGTSGRQIQGYTVELALKGKTFGSYIGDVSGTALNGGALLSRVSGTGNPTLSMLSVSAVTIPASGYLGQVNLRASRALTSSDVLAVQSASTAGAGGVQNLDVSQAVLTFAQAPACPGDFNGDGKVNLADFLAFAGGFGTRSGDANYDARLDMDGSGSVDLSDFLTFASVFGNTCPTPASPPVSIPDANLRAVIEDSLGKARGAEITRAEMAGLILLEAPNLGISDLTGLEYGVNLTELNLGSNNITDISPLFNLINLRVLHLYGNGLSDWPQLQRLTGLVSLNLGYCDNLDLSVVSSLSNLTDLNLPGNGITDVSPLSNLPKLERLSLFDNRIKDVSLTGLPNLKELDLRYNGMTDVSSLSGLANLVLLQLAFNSVSDISPLSNLTNLEALGLTQNSISDVSTLSGLTKLSGLGLGNNKITDVSALSRLTNLWSLGLENNRIVDLAPLVANTGLGPRDKVDVRGNPLSATSIDVHVPALEGRGVSVSFDETIVFTEPRIYNDNVFVLPVTENLGAGNLPLDEYAKRFYTYFNDAFDFLVFLPSLSWSQLDADAFKGAFYAGVGNNIQGIGKGAFFNDRWGSAGKLQGGLFFAFVSEPDWEHSRLVRGPMLHELMHRWANHIVAPAIPHWDFTSADGILGGFDIATLVDHGGRSLQRSCSLYRRMGAQPQAL